MNIAAAKICISIELIGFQRFPLICQWRNHRKVFRMKADDRMFGTGDNFCHHGFDTLGQTFRHGINRNTGPVSGKTGDSIMQAGLKPRQINSIRLAQRLCCLLKFLDGGFEFNRGLGLTFGEPGGVSLGMTGFMTSVPARSNAAFVFCGQLGLGEDLFDLIFFSILSRIVSTICFGGNSIIGSKRLIFCCHLSLRYFLRRFCNSLIFGGVGRFTVPLLLCRHGQLNKAACLKGTL